MHQSELHPGFNFAIMHDAGALKTCAATIGCDVTQTLIDDLNYVNVTYSGSTAYLRFGGRPVIYFFGHEAYAIDWARVRAGVAGNPMFIFRNGSGFTKAQSNGAFSWVAPETVTSTNLMGMNYLDNYYKTALSFPSAYSTGSGYKGFNDTLAPWGANRIIGQQCGQTWLNDHCRSRQVLFRRRPDAGHPVVTWNDYEEGSEIETGIDNCVSVSASVAGTVVSWSITGQMNTVDHFTVFASQDGANLMWLADAPTTATSLDLAQFSLNSGNYIVFVKAVGQTIAHQQDVQRSAAHCTQPTAHGCVERWQPHWRPVPSTGSNRACEQSPLQPPDQRTRTAALWQPASISAMAAPR